MGIIGGYENGRVQEEKCIVTKPTGDLHVFDTLLPNGRRERVFAELESRLIGHKGRSDSFLYYAPHFEVSFRPREPKPMRIVDKREPVCDLTYNEYVGASSGLLEVLETFYGPGYEQFDRLEVTDHHRIQFDNLLRLFLNELQNIK